MRGLGGNFSIIPHIVYTRIHWARPIRPTEKYNIEKQKKPAELCSELRKKVLYLQIVFIPFLVRQKISLI